MRETSSPRELLLGCFPDLAHRAATVVESGLDNLVLDVAGEWIVRLPRRPSVQAHISAEVALLRELAPVLSLPVPQPQLSPSGRAPAMRYRKLAGTSADEHLARPYRLALAARAGRFLNELHAFPAHRAVQLGIHAYDPLSWHEQLEIFYARAREHAFPLLDAAEREQAARFIEPQLAHEPAFGFTLTHGDLTPDHLLCDTTGAITGVIDWTDARIADPAVDLAWLIHGTDREFGQAVLHSYRADTCTRLLERARFYYQISPWHVLIFGLEHGRPDLIEKGLRDLRERLTQSRTNRDARRRLSDP